MRGDKHDSSTVNTLMKKSVIVIIKTLEYNEACYFFLINTLVLIKVLLKYELFGELFILL